MNSRISIAVVLLSCALHAQAQIIEGSLADALGIGANGNAAQSVLAGTAGAGIPIPSAALGILPGEPVLIVNTDFNVVAVAGGAIEEATGGVIPGGAAQSIIRAGLSGGDVVQVITTQAADIVATAVEQQSGGFIPRAASRAVIATAIDGGDVGDALTRVAFDLIVNEAAKLLAGSVGTSVQNATRGVVDANTIERIFNGAIRGQSLGPLFRNALRERFRNIRQPTAQNNPIVIINAALASP